MKKLLILPFVALIFASCSNADTTSDPVADVTVKTNMVANGNWKVTQFTDSGKDETSDFSGYTFSFNTNGTFLASSSTGSFSGIWTFKAGSNSPDDSGSSSDDDSSDKLTITVTGNKLMEKLSHEWLVDRINATEIWLRDDNAASNEYLRFGK